MTIVDLYLSKIKEKYQVLCEQDLGEFFTKPSGDLYFSLKSHHRNEFLDDQRLVFFIKNKMGSSTLEPLLTRFINCITRIDLPAFFILLLVDEDVFDQTNAMCQGITVVKARGIAVDDVIDNPKHFQEPPVACGLPWTTLHIDQNEHLRPCCQYRESIKKTDTSAIPMSHRFDSTEKVFYGPYMTMLREKFRQGTRLDNCKRCWRNETLESKSSERLNFKSRFVDYFGISWETEGSPLIVTFDQKDEDLL